MKKQSQGSESGIVMLGSLKLRGVIACVSRASDRVLPRVKPKYLQMCTDVRDMTWSFAAGEPASILELWRLAKRAEVLTEPSERSPALKGIRLARLAAQNSYDAVGNFPLSHEKASCALQNAEAAVALLVNASGSPAQQALLRDAEKLKETHRGDVFEPGVPINAGPEGELGPLWIEGEQPSWWQSPEHSDDAWVEPALMAVRGVLNVDAVVRDQPTFICFFVEGDREPKDIHDPVLSDVMSSLERYAGPSSWKRRPGFVVYVSRIDHPTYLKLVLKGALVVTQDKLVGGRPKNVEEFVVAYRESLYQWAHPVVRSEWRRSRSESARSAAKASAEVSKSDQNTSVADLREPNAERLNDLVSRLGTAFPLPEF